MFYYSGDPVADYNSYCDEQEKEEAKLPVCDVCGETIYDEFCYDIDGDIFCEKCMKDNFRRRTEDLMEGD